MIRNSDRKKSPELRFGAVMVKLPIVSDFSCVRTLVVLKVTECMMLVGMVYPIELLTLMMTIITWCFNGYQTCHGLEEHEEQKHKTNKKYSS